MAAHEAPTLGLLSHLLHEPCLMLYRAPEKKVMKEPLLSVILRVEEGAATAAPGCFWGLINGQSRMVGLSRLMGNM